MPFFSIVTPSFNQGAFVKKCLQSVATQSFRDFEHIIQDGGSSDGTVEALEEYAAARANVVLRVEQDGGQVDAINRGFAAARGDYLIWLNTDDFLADERVLEDVHAALDREQPDFLYGRGEFVDAEGRFLRDVFINDDPSRLRDRFLVSVGILQPATFIRRECFARLGPLLEEHPFCFDYEFWMRGAFAGCGFRYLDRMMTRATLHSDSKTVGDRVKSLRDTCEVNRRYYGFASLPWLQKLVDCEVSGADGIVTRGSGKSSGDQLRKRFAEFNGSKASHSAILSRAHVAEAVDSVQMLRSQWTTDTRNAVVTAFDDAFFASGLTLISGLQRLETVFAVFVYDIGLTSAQRDLLNGLKDVFVLDFDRDLAGDCEGYFSPRTYGFKSYCMWHARHYLENGDRLLWLDAGVYPLSDLKRTLEVIDSAGVFLVDHDDKGIWPVQNITFTSDDCIAALSASPGELMAPHLRAGVAGYKVGGRFQRLFDDAYEHSRDPRALCGDKHPKPPVYRKRSGGTPEERKRALEDPAWLDRLPVASLRSMFGYFGHRHDQSILSILAARAGAPHQSALEFCIADDASSASSRQRWSNGGEVSASDRIPDYYSRSHAELMQHRGLFRNTEDLSFERSRITGPAVILGNGPSLRGFDFARLKGFDVFGMNAAYRYWQEIGWYPAYYACLDLVVGVSHRDAIAGLIEHADDYGMRLFLLRQNLIDELGSVGRSEKVVNFDELRHHVSLLQAPTITTGSHTAAWAATLGYRNIYLLGIDCNYVERIDGSRDVGVGTELEIVEEKSNPNYFFDGYQRKGDRYNVPNPGRDIHITSWREVAGRVRASGAIMLNANLESKVDSIDFCRFEDIEGGGDPDIISRTEILGPLAYQEPEPEPDPESSVAADAEPSSPDDAVTASPGGVSESAGTPAARGPTPPPAPRTAVPSATSAAGAASSAKPSSTPARSRTGQRLTDLMAAALRHARRYGLLVVPLAALGYWFAYETLTATGVRQQVALGLLVALALGGMLLVGAEAARRMRLHVMGIQRQIDATRQSIERLRGEASSQLRESSRQVQAALQSAKRVSDDLGAAERVVAELQSRLAESDAATQHVRQMIEQMDARHDGLETRLGALVGKLDELVDGEAMGALRAEVDTLIGRLSSTVTVEQLDYRMEEMQARLEALDQVGAQLDELRKASAKLGDEVRSLPGKNLTNFVMFNRALTPRHVAEYREVWARALGVSPPDRSLYYLAHRVTILEGLLRGRLATDVETAVLRALVLESLQKKSVQVLEIGTLFGIGAASLYDHARDRFERVDLTLLDPLDGYYGADRDVLSGIPVNEHTLRANLSMAGVPDGRFRLIKHFSYADEAVKAASDREYDYLLIDGDHTRSGVEIDFTHYAGLLCRGGLLVFDDYGSKEWPEVAEFVDDVVTRDERFARVGSGWRTAVFRRVV